MFRFCEFFIQSLVLVFLLPLSLPWLIAQGSGLSATEASSRACDEALQRLLAQKQAALRPNFDRTERVAETQ